MAGKQFYTKEKEEKIVEFEWDDRPLVFTVPKKSGLIASVVNNVGLDARSLDTDSTRDLLNWLGEGFSDEDGEWVFNRLTDPDDTFDLEDVNEMAKYILGQASNRPSKRRRG
jgi:hypothetical protein